ncbi:MAG: hypothetical protein KGL39_23150 [Patescibacteria group bacterium]|nr:hypothetical protein [Patescibacteria group bacterium]
MFKWLERMRRINELEEERNILEDRLRSRDSTVREMRRRMQEAVDSKNLSTSMYIIERTLKETDPSPSRFMAMFTDEFFEQSKGRPKDILPLP